MTLSMLEKSHLVKAAVEIRINLYSGLHVIAK
jgi:hypothetical protein